jgi:hypothetical protein
MLDAATDGDGNIEFEKAAEGFTYFVGERSDPKRGDFKSPFADLIDGSKKVVYRGVTAALSRNGSVKGISAEERKKGKSFLEGQRDRFPKNDKGDAQEIVIQFQAGEADRSKGRILVASGTQSRNVDFWTGKHYRLVPAGMRTEYWENNPLVFYMHHFLIPLGTGSNMFVEDGKLWMPDNIQFHRKKVPVWGFFGGADDFDTGVIADLWDERVLKAVSIHVMMTREDLANIVENDDEIIIPTSEVIEVSVVTIPGDREAVREEEYIAELLERMETRGVDREMAECVSCNAGTYIPPLAMLRQSKSDQAANKGSMKELVKPEVSMSKKEVEKTAPEAEVVEIETPEVEETVLEETVEFEQEIELPVLDLAQAIAQDGQALQTLAMALVEVPEFVQAVSAAVFDQGSTALEAGITEVIPQRVKVVFSGSGQQRETRQEQAAQPVQRPVAVRQAAAAPVALPQANGRTAKRKPGVLDLVRPSR